MLKKEPSRDNSEHPQAPDLFASMEKELQMVRHAPELQKIEYPMMSASLNLDVGGSLALNGQHSIENGIPIPRNMLSR